MITILNEMALGEMSYSVDGDKSPETVSRNVYHVHITSAIVNSLVTTDKDYKQDIFTSRAIKVTLKDFKADLDAVLAGTLSDNITLRGVRSAYVEQINVLSKSPYAKDNPKIKFEALYKKAIEKAKKIKNKGDY